MNCVCVCVCVCLCQTGASPFAPAGCSQSIEDDFSFFSHAESFEEISKHSQSALHVLSCVQCKGFFLPPPLPPSICCCLPFFLSVQSRNTLSGRRRDSQSRLSGSSLVITEKCQFSLGSRAAAWIVTVLLHVQSSLKTQRQSEQTSP